MLTSLFRLLVTRSPRPFVFTKAGNEIPDIGALSRPGLYVHIPFCRSLCSFCPYNKELYNEEAARCYTGALLCEIDTLCAGMVKKKEATSLYFGGGTPALLADELPEIIQRLTRYFVLTEGIGVELHSDDVTPEILTKLKAAGVTMVSLGIQSFDESSLTKIGRRYDGFREKVQLAAGYGFDAVDVDLIFAIPGQDEKSLHRDVEAAFQCGATQVSTYPFIDFTFAHNGYRPLPDRVKRRLLRSLALSAKEMDLRRTSVWTFAKKGTPRYSSVTREPFVGFGAGAASLLQNSFRINTFGVADYCEAVEGGKLPAALELKFKGRQRAAYHLFWAAYGLCIGDDAYRAATERDLPRDFGGLFLGARALGLLKKDGTDYLLTERGSVLYHILEQKYTAAYIDRTWGALKKEAYPDRIELL